MRRGQVHKGDTIIEAEFPDTEREQLDSLVDSLAELLTQERMRELQKQELEFAIAGSQADSDREVI